MQTKLLLKSMKKERKKPNKQNQAKAVHNFVQDT